MKKTQKNKKLFLDFKLFIQIASFWWVVVVMLFVLALMVVDPGSAAINLVPAAGQGGVATPVVTASNEIPDEVRTNNNAYDFSIGNPVVGSDGYTYINHTSDYKGIVEKIDANNNSKYCYKSDDGYICDSSLPSAMKALNQEQMSSGGSAAFTSQQIGLVESQIGQYRTPIKILTQAEVTETIKTTPNLYHPIDGTGKVTSDGLNSTVILQTPSGYCINKTSYWECYNSQSEAMSQQNLYSQEAGGSPIWTQGEISSHYSDPTVSSTKVDLDISQLNYSLDKLSAKIDQIAKDNPTPTAKQSAWDKVSAQFNFSDLANASMAAKEATDKGMCGEENGKKIACITCFNGTNYYFAPPGVSCPDAKIESKVSQSQSSTPTTVGAVSSTPAKAVNKEATYAAQPVGTTTKLTAGLGSIKNLVAETGAQSGLQGNSPGYVFGGIIQWLLGLVGIVYLALTIYAGFLWLTAAGKEDQVNKARGILIQSVIALIIILSAWVITYFVTQNVLKATNSKINL